MTKHLNTRALILSMAIVTCLTLISQVTQATVLFLLLYPGFSLSLLITGGHGGTHVENIVAFAAAFIVNVAVYAALFATCMAILGRAKQGRTAL